MYSLKTSENLWFSDFFRDYRKETIDMVWVKAENHQNSNYQSVAKFVKKSEIGKTIIRTPK